MYFLITSAVTSSPTLRTKYPAPQNSPAHSLLLSCGYFSKISRAEMLFMLCTTLVGEYFGGVCMKRCTGSFWTDISSICHSYSLAILRKTCLAYSATSPSKIFFLYFGTHTMWYLTSYTACFVRLIRLIPLSYIFFYFCHPHSPAFILAASYQVFCGVRIKEGPPYGSLGEPSSHFLRLSSGRNFLSAHQLSVYGHDHRAQRHQ